MSTGCMDQTAVSTVQTTHRDTALAVKFCNHITLITVKVNWMCEKLYTEDPRITFAISPLVAKNEGL